MTSIYPKLPGHFISHDPTKTDFKKISSSQYNKVLYNEFNLKTTVHLPRQSTPEKIEVRNGASLSYSQDTFLNPFDTNISEQFQPDFVKLDKQVLRFYGYFNESIVESKLENSRIRKLIIFYYITDYTISINEERETNSGIVQGLFLKRKKIKKENGEFYNFSDFCVGLNIFIFGKIIKLVDCDEYTREFYNDQNIVQPDKINYAVDIFHELNNKNKDLKKKTDNSMKDYLEHKLGGGKVQNQKQFLENDRKVLKFFSKYEGRDYIIHYFLADDTVEIREMHRNNSGCDPFPVFLKRGKLPRKFSISQPGNLEEADFYKDKDIEPRMTLWAFNRPFKIFGCDEFTKRYYDTIHDRVFPIGGLDEIYHMEKEERELPPYNGWGNEIDSRGNCLRLIPKQPLKDFYKYVDKDLIILRFKARLNSQLIEDNERVFLISYFMSDDGIQIYEIPKKNSGIWEGKILERGNYKNDENNDIYFNITDFYINKSIRINSNSYFIFDADEFTKKWLAVNLI